MTIEGVQRDGDHGRGSRGSGESVMGRKGILGRWGGAWARGGLTEYIPFVRGKGKDSRPGGKASGGSQEAVRWFVSDEGFGRRSLNIGMIQERVRWIIFNVWPGRRGLDIK